MKTHYYSVLTDKVYATVSASMREQPGSYYKVSFSALSKENLEERKGYAAAYMQDRIRADIEASLAADKDICILAKPAKLGCISLHSFDASERESDIDPCIIRKLPRLSKYNDASDIFLEVVSAHEDKFLVFKDGYYYDNIVVIKTEAIKETELSDGSYCRLSIHTGRRTFQRFLTHSEFYDEIATDKATIEKYKFRPGVLSKFVKEDLISAKKTAEKSRKAYDSSLKKYNRLKEIYDGLDSGDKLIAELGD